MITTNQTEWPAMAVAVGYRQMGNLRGGES